MPSGREINSIMPLMSDNNWDMLHDKKKPQHNHNIDHNTGGKLVGNVAVVLRIQDYKLVCIGMCALHAT